MELRVKNEAKWYLFRIYVTCAQDKPKQYCCCFFFPYFIQLCDSRKIHYLTHESALNCTWKPISHSSLRDLCNIGFRVQFNAEFPRQVMNFPIKYAQHECHIQWLYIPLVATSEDLGSCSWPTLMRTTLSLSGPKNVQISQTKLDWSHHGLALWNVSHVTTGMLITSYITVASFQGVKLRLIWAPMRLNFSLWRPNSEN